MVFCKGNIFLRSREELRRHHFNLLRQIQKVIIWIPTNFAVPVKGRILID